MPRGGTNATRRTPAGRRFWLELFTLKAWMSFRQGGRQVTTFRASEWRTVKGIRPGDYLLCYLSDVHRWVGALEVTGPPFLDRPMSAQRNVPFARVPMMPVAMLSPETGIPPDAVEAGM